MEPERDPETQRDRDPKRGTEKHGEGDGDSKRGGRKGKEKFRISENQWVGDRETQKEG